MRKTVRSHSVSKRALLQRINRRLQKDDYFERVSAVRSDYARQELGDFYRIDLHKNVVIGKDVDLEQLGRELKVLGTAESLKH